MGVRVLGSGEGLSPAPPHYTKGGEAMRFMVKREKGGGFTVSVDSRRQLPGMPNHIKGVKRGEVGAALGDLIHGSFPDEVRPKPKPGA